MKKKILIATVIFILIIGAILFVIADPFGWFYSPSPQQEMFMANINASNSVVLYYGDLDPDKEVAINYKKVTEFTEKTIGDSKNKYEYHTIVIFDFDGKMDISDEELLLIKDYCENGHYDLLYYGDAHMAQFKKCGFFETIDPNAQGFIYNGSYWMEREMEEEWLNPYLVLGNWWEDDSEEYNTGDVHYMWKFVIMEINDLIEESRGEGL